MILSINHCFSQRSKDSLKVLKAKVPKELTFNYDRFDGIIWISSEPFKVGGTLSSVELSLYFGIYDNGTITPLRIKQTYKASSWIFIKCFKFLLGKASEEQRRYTLCDSNMTTSTVSSGISEKSDLPIDDEMKKMLIDFTETKCNFLIKVEGDDKYDTVGWAPVFNTKFPEQLLSVINTYKLFGGAF